jgi:nucleoside-triphosphatase
MEIRSSIFRDAVNEALHSGLLILGTIVARSLPFTDAIKKRSDISLIEVRLDNRQRLCVELSDRFKT